MVRDVVGDVVGNAVGNMVGDVVRWRLDQKEDAVILNTSGGRDSNT